jgi:hypothetical protein
MVVTNQGDVPVRFAADGRLLSFEVPKPEDPGASPAKKKPKAPPPIVCKLPPELRPSGVVDDRAVVLEPGARYEEVISPFLYCFNEASAKALVAGATVVAKLGFTPRPTQGAGKAHPAAPFVAEPALANATVSAVKELVSEPFVVPSGGPVSGDAPSSTSSDASAPRLELVAPARVDTLNELTVGMTFTVKNSGGRPALIHLRRDNFMFEVDGPSGSAHCGFPADMRSVPKDAFTALAAGASRPIDVWVGEMCSDVVFDRPGLYRIWASLAFPGSNAGSTMKVWTDTISASVPVLVRVREGRLPFYTSLPQVFSAAR